MTSIPLSSLPVTDEWRRDRWGRYLCRPPGEDKPIGYTRVTTAAKALDDGGALAPWKATAACVGSIIRPGLRARWETILGTHGPSPWYAGQAAKAECKRLVEECATAGGATDRREVGTSLHALTALLDVGRAPEHVTTETARDLLAYRTTLEAAGIEIIGELVEQVVVLDDYQVAGTFDRGARVPGFSSLLVTDLKSGSDLSYSWPSISVQLAAYANANALYKQGAALDGSEDVRSAMPPFDKSNGLVIWLNSATGECTLHLVDIAAGWEAFQHSMWARSWRKAVVSRPLAEGPFVRAPVDLGAALEASLDQVTQEDVDLGLIDEVPPADFTTQLRGWLQEWIDLVGGHEQARADLGRSWPSGVPTLLRSSDHTPEQLAAIEAALKGVTKRHVIVWPSPRPEPADAEALVLHMFPGTTKEQ